MGAGYPPFIPSRRSDIAIKWQSAAKDGFTMIEARRSNAQRT
ncbi:hypothetical protein ECTX1999_1736 [Escherichia coli TX1999]|nr:hypothetical protein ECTX1999_1736 [Escherichia coli TX1999]